MTNRIDSSPSLRVLITEHRERQGKSPAIRSSDNAISLNYVDLDNQVSRVGVHLRDNGVANTECVTIMNDEGEHLSPEHVGEIAIRGENVTAGYLRNPEANETAFSNGWFRTGDLGRIDQEGYLWITGRKKEMINRGGENISPREIDESLLQHPAVVQAVAFAVPHPSLGEDVAAAVILRDGTAAGGGELREFLFGHLSGFKVPSRILIVNSIPKGPTGKLQRIGLHEKLKDDLHALFQNPTLVGQAELVESSRTTLRHSQQVELRDLLEGIDGMSENQAQRLLGEASEDE